MRFIFGLFTVVPITSMTAYHPSRVIAAGQPTTTLLALMHVDVAPNCRRFEPVQNSRMNWLNNDGEPQSLQAGHWSVQPAWAKLYTICVGLPAWAFLMFGDFGDLATDIGAGLFASAVLIQVAFVFRGYWRMNI